MVPMEPEVTETPHPTKSVKIFLTAYLCLGWLSLILIYVATEYFQTARLSEFMSFISSDAPGPLLKNLYPNPVGNHFFGDFLLTFRLSQQASPYFTFGIFPFYYFPLAAVLMGPFVLFDYWLACTLFISLGVIGFFLVCWRGLSHLNQHSRKVIITLVFLSGPMFSVIDRGNISLFLTLICIAGVLQLPKGNYYKSAIFWGIAGAMKGYPVLYLLIFVRRRQWKTLAVGMATFFLGITIPLGFYGNGFLNNLKEMVSQFIVASSQQRAANVRAYNSSLLSFFDTLRTSFGGHFDLSFQFLISNYSIIALIVTITFLIFSMSRHATDFESLLLITVTVCLIPQTISFYVLLLYFVPLLFYWASDLSCTRNKNGLMLLIAIIMVPKGLPLWNPFGTWSPSVATYTSLVNPGCGLLIALICISAISLSYWKSKKSDNGLQEIQMDLQQNTGKNF